MAKLRKAMVLLVALTVIGMASAASADTVSGAITTEGKRYRGGDPAAAGVYYAASVQVARNGDGDIVNVRAAANITKIRGARAVQVDRVALGTSTTGVIATGARANSGTGPTTVNVTDWVRVRPGTCTSYRVRSNYSVRWDDGATSAFSVLSPLTEVCGRPVPDA